VKDLQAQGLSQRAIARRLGWNRRTVRRYMVADQAPVRGLGPQAQSRASAYGPYLRRRWAEGVRHRVQLWQELVAQGYQGSYASMYRFLIRLFGLGRTARVARSQGSPAPAPPQRASSGPEEVRPLTARQARWLLL
jgi:hypothetical protein